MKEKNILFRLWLLKYITYHKRDGQGQKCQFLFDCAPTICWQKGENCKPLDLII